MVRRWWAPGDPRLPWELSGGVTLLGGLPFGVVCALAIPHHPAISLVLFAILVTLLGWFSTLGGGLLAGLLGWLCLTGFVVNSDGQLHWHGPADALRAGLLLAAGVGAAGAHALQLGRRAR